MSYRTLLRWAALPVTNRRWGAPLCAIALGFGLFVGVAIGPNAAGTLATTPLQVIEMPMLGRGGGAEESAEVGVSEEPFVASSEGAEDFSSEAEASAFTAVESVEEEPLAPVEESDSPGPAPASADEEEKAELEEPELVGTVVHVNPAAASYTVAEAGGVMSAVHAGKLPAVGSAVEVPIRTLANGTVAEAGKRVKTGSEKGAKLAGIVTFVVADAAVPAYVVSNRGSSVLVRVDPDPTGSLPSLPTLGAFVTATVEIAPSAPALTPTPSPPPAEVVTTASCVPDPALPPLAPVAAKGSLSQRSISAPGAPFTHAELSGIVVAVCPQTAQLLLSADGIGESVHDLLLAVPAELDVNGLTIGDSAIAAVDIGADGALTLTGLASDERLKGADDEQATQGDLVPDKPKGER